MSKAVMSYKAARGLLCSQPFGHRLADAWAAQDIPRFASIAKTVELIFSLFSGQLAALGTTKKTARLRGAMADICDMLPRLLPARDGSGSGFGSGSAITDTGDHCCPGCGCLPPPPPPVGPPPPPPAPPSASSDGSARCETKKKGPVWQPIAVAHTRSVGDRDRACVCRMVQMLALAIEPCAAVLSARARAALVMVQHRCRGCRPLANSSTVTADGQQAVAGSAVALDPVAEVAEAFRPYSIPVGGWELHMNTRKTVCGGGCGRKIRLYCIDCGLEAAPVHPTPACPQSMPVPPSTPVGVATAGMPPTALARPNGGTDPRPAIRDTVGSAMPPGLTVHAVLHPKIKRGNQTCVHAKLLTPPGRVVLHRLHEAPLLAFDPATTLIVYPSTQSTTFAAVPPAEFDLATLRALVVIEATWEDAATVLRHPSLAQVRHVKLELGEDRPSSTAGGRGTNGETGAGSACGGEPCGRAGLYWRATPQITADNTSSSKGAGATVFLSTIEAIRLALVQLREHQPRLAPDAGPAFVRQAGTPAALDALSHPSANATGLVASVGAVEGLDGLLFYLHIEALRRAESIQSRLGNRVPAD